MLVAAMWGAVASLSLLAGSIAALFLSIPKRIIAYFMALGTGILIGLFFRAFNQIRTYKWNRSNCYYFFNWSGFIYLN